MPKTLDTGKTFCPGCTTLKKNNDFYRTNNYDKFPTGRLPTCKRCRTLMVNNWDASTFLDILEECDVPWVPKEWNSLLATYALEPEKCNTTSIIGKYLSKMQLIQYNKDRWADTELIREKNANEIRLTLAAQGFDGDAIEQAIIDSEKLLPYPGTKEDETASYNADGTINHPELLEDYFASDEDVSYENDLTDDDKKYLRLKWGKTYNTDELIRLEKLYREMEESFDIQNASHRDTLVKACKTSLKSDQLLDIGDVEGAQKMIKMYETLMKMGKFTAVQNKAEQGECLETVSELTLMCEKEGFIPRFYISTPNDMVDQTLADMNEYVSDLIKGESNLEAMIEMAVKQIYEQEHREEDEDADDDELNLEDIENIVKDDDFSDFNDFIEEEQEMTDESINNFFKGEEEYGD